MTNVPGRKRSQIARGARSLAGFVLLALALTLWHLDSIRRS
jgi:hypothetical protein